VALSARFVCRCSRVSRRRKEALVLFQNNPTENWTDLSKWNTRAGGSKVRLVVAGREGLREVRVEKSNLDGEVSDRIG
jgi:hypothetical protein